MQPEKANQSSLRQIDSKIMICDNLKDALPLYDQANVMAGVKPAAEREKVSKDIAKDPNALKLPDDLFEDFVEIDQRNEDLFEFVSLTVVSNYILSCLLRLDTAGKAENEVMWELKGILEDESKLKSVTSSAKWDTALEFPDTIASTGRVKLHAVADSFGLAHHSVGRKGKSRRTVMYPRTMFEDKQKTETARLHRERDKLRESYNKNYTFQGEAPTKNTTFPEKVMLELWYERNNKEPEDQDVKSYLPSMEEVGKAPDVKSLIEVVIRKQKEASRLGDNQKRLSERLQLQVELLKNQADKDQEEALSHPKSKEPVKKKDDKDDEEDDLASSDSEEQAFEDMDPECKVAYIHRQVRIIE